MRVYELAQVLRLRSRDLVARLRGDGDWVASHLSSVPEPVAARYLARRPVDPERPAVDVDRRTGARPSPPPPEPPPARRLRFKGRPGPRPFTKQQPWSGDEWDDPMDDLRYLPEITTGDVAQLAGVTLATVRRWVARGYLTPIGKYGQTNLFDPRQVLAALDAIAGRRKATGQPRRQHGYYVDLRASDRIRPKHYDAVVDPREAARLIGVSPATIRSWIHRGHVVPLASSKPRAVRLRLGDVISAAQSRQLPKRGIQPGSRRTRPVP